MDDSKLLEQIAEMLDAQNRKVDEMLKAQHQQTLEQVAEMIEAQTLKLEMKIEHDVTDRLDALADGYKLNHEKQWELDHKLKALEERVSRLEIKAG